jgi:hypothetical protein
MIAAGVRDDNRRTKCFAEIIGDTDFLIFEAIASTFSNPEFISNSGASSRATDWHAVWINQCSGETAVYCFIESV